ncbi:putative MFS transporter [Actinoplanes missouriensis 431]|uniref:Putative MFS transporter n=1 Tax=Actinoplanes missouriensis (strain ATCC 14538 / DSM 43046 / CBS 188.64 / JCM 3121 / NBRC 102363 / NCIMB 12654 / NRRL B-3342 / UNCC 431) TaxID=512565 RepID=I0H704_ACTM4|nr:MFS transporter [Actinoplanes missouriensis]BAL88791.1 putative MFS transporter [Actinoplanes missouriensis 431]
MTPPVRPRLLLLAAAAASFLLSLIQSIPVPVLPQIAQQLGADATTVGWVSTATLLAASACTPLLGRLGHVVGIKPVFIGTLIVTLVGSLIAATVQDVTWLIVARVLQGTSFGLFPLGMSLLRHELPPAKLTSGMATVASTLGVGGGVALVASGLLMQGDGDYRRIFWLCVAVTALALALAFTLPRRAGAGGRVDVLGAVVLSAGLVSLLLPISQGHTWGWTSARVLLLFTAAVVILVGFYLLERRTAAPLVSVEMLRHRPILVANLAAMAVGFAMFALQLSTSYFVQSPRAYTGFGFSATVLETSLVFLLPGAAASVVVGPLAGVLMGRIGPRNVLALACGLAAAGMASLTLLHDNRVETITAFVVASCAIAMAYAAMPALLVSHVQPAETGIANSVNSIMRTVGGTIGGALVITILAARTHSYGTLALPTENAFRLSYGIGAVIFAIGGLLVLLFIDRPARARAEEPVVAAPAPAVV